MSILRNRRRRVHRLPRRLAVIAAKGVDVKLGFRRLVHLPGREGEVMYRIMDLFFV